jgi:hypothetical protein
MLRLGRVNCSFFLSAANGRARHMPANRLRRCLHRSLTFDIIAAFDDPIFNIYAAATVRIFARDRAVREWRSIRDN